MQVIKLIGIVDDGSKLNSRMPRNTSTTIDLTMFASSQVVVDVFYNSGVEVDLTGMTGTLSMVRNIDPQQDDPNLSVDGSIVTGDNGRKNRLTFDIAPADSQLPLGRYFFDVFLTQGSQRWQIVRTSLAVLTPGLSR